MRKKSVNAALTSGRTIKGILPFFCYFCGVLGYLELICDILAWNYRRLPVCLLMTALGVGLWLLKDVLRVRPGAVLGAGLFPAALYFVIFHKSVLIRIWMIQAAEQWNPRAERLLDMTGIFILAALAGIPLIYLVTGLARKAWLFFLLTVFLVLAGIVMVRPLRLEPLILVMVFHLGGQLEAASAKPAGKRGTFPGLVFLALLVLLSGGFFVVKNISENHMEKLYRVSSQTGDRLGQWIAGRLNTDAGKGRINRGGIYPQDREELELISQKKPDKTIYLKNFIGELYENGSWSGAKSDELSSERQYTLINNLKTQVKIQNSQENENTEPVMSPFSEETTMNIRYLSSSLSGYFIPYFSRKIQGGEKDNYQVSMFEGDDYSQALNLLPLFGYSAEMAYKEKVRQENLKVPVESVPLLSELCSSHPQEGIGEITRFILETLHGRASYSLQPGVAPWGKDPTEYFLLEQGKGYCQHYATAAALMYRLYGIPARYVTGFLAPPEEFEKQKDGTYRAVLTDARAHAWVEIYLEDSGWLMLEVTPPGSVPGAEPALGEKEKTKDSDEAPERTVDSRQEKEEENTSEDENENPEEDAAKEAAQDKKEVTEHEQNIPAKSSPGLSLLKNIFVKIRPVLEAAAAAALFCLLMVLRRCILLRRQERYGPGKILLRLQEVLRLGEVIPDCDILKPEFVDSLAGCMEGITLLEAAMMQKAALQESFGKRPPSPRQCRETRKLYKKICARIVKDLPWYKRIYFRYGKVYG